MRPTASVHHPACPWTDPDLRASRRYG